MVSRRTRPYPRSIIIAYVYLYTNVILLYVIACTILFIVTKEEGEGGGRDSTCFIDETKIPATSVRRNQIYFLAR